MLKELKTYIVAVAIGIMSLSVAFPSYAKETYNCFRIEDSYDWLGNYIKENNLGNIEDTYFFFSDKNVEIANELNMKACKLDITEDLVYAMNIWQRKCAPYASGDVVYIPYMYYGGQGSTAYDSTLFIMLRESSIVKGWLDENMQSIVPEGTYVDDAIKIIYDWIQDNCSYEYRYDEQKNDTYSWKVDYSLNDMKVCCVGYASLFRNMVNYLTSDLDGNVVYLEDDDIGPAYRKLNMYVVSGNEHAWNAVRDFKTNEWRYFDPTFDDRGDGQHHYRFFNLTADEFYDGKEYMVSGDIGEEPHAWVRGMYRSDMEFYNDYFEVTDINLLK